MDETAISIELWANAMYQPRNLQILGQYFSYENELMVVKTLDINNIVHLEFKKEMMNKKIYIKMKFKDDPREYMFYIIDPDMTEALYIKLFLKKIYYELLMLMPNSKLNEKLTRYYNIQNRIKKVTDPQHNKRCYCEQCLLDGDE